TIVFCIASDVTTPTRVLRRPGSLLFSVSDSLIVAAVGKWGWGSGDAGSRASGALRGEEGLDPGHLAAGGADAGRILELAGLLLDAEHERFLFQFAAAGRRLVDGQLAQFF